MKPEALTVEVDCSELDEITKKVERLVSLLKEVKNLINQLSGNSGISEDELVKKVIPVIQKSIDDNVQEVPHK